MVMEWIRGRTIGQGSSATVSLATTSSGDLLAVKTAELRSSVLLQRERDFVSELNSPYVVTYVDGDVTFENGVALYNLLMEYFPGGTLSDQVKHHGGVLEEPLIQKFTLDVLRGLEYLHSKGIVHCDIKGQNVLVGKNGAKIGDFGCAKVVGEEGQISGTPLYMAPEVARGEEQSFTGDIWSVGCIVVEMATGNNPWPNLTDPVSALYRIGYSGDVPCFPASLSDSGKDFLSKCLTRDAKDRWTAKELLRHPFLINIEEDGVELLRNSPTCVLDQAFWNSVDESPEFSGGSSEMASPMANRINNLIGDVTSFPIWNDDDDEDWIIIREIEPEEIPANDADDDEDLDQDQEPEIEEYPLLSSLVLLFDCLSDDENEYFNVSLGTNDPTELDVLYFENEIMKPLSFDAVFVLYRNFVPFRTSKSKFSQKEDLCLLSKSKVQLWAHYSFLL